jgi:hypothetical protein
MTIEEIIKLAYANGQANQNHNTEQREKFFAQIPELISKTTPITHELSGRVVKEVITEGDEQLFVFTDGSWFIQYGDTILDGEFSIANKNTILYYLDMKVINLLDQSKRITEL